MVWERWVCPRLVDVGGVGNLSSDLKEAVETAEDVALQVVHPAEARAEARVLKGKRRGACGVRAKRHHLIPDKASAQGGVIEE